MAYMQGDQVAVLQPNTEAKGFRYDQQKHELVPTEVDPQLKKTALAYALWGSHSYKNQLYKSKSDGK